MDIKKFTTLKAPVSKNPISQSIKVGPFLFISGTGPADPKTGRVAEGIDQQTRQALDNVKTIVEEGGSSMNLVVKTTVFLKNISDAPKMNAYYAGYFPTIKPTRSCVEVSAFGNPSWLIEIEAIAVLENENESKKY